MQKKILVVLAFITLTFLSLPSQAIQVQTPGGSLTLQTKQWAGVSFVCLSDLASGLGGTVGEDPVSRYPQWTVGGHRFLFSTFSAVVSLDGRIIKLSKPSRKDSGCLWVPLDFLTEALPKALGGPVKILGAAQSEAHAAPAAGKVQAGQGGLTPKVEETGITMQIALSVDRIRFTFTGEGASDTKLTRKGQRLEVRMSKGTVNAQERGLGSGIATAVKPLPAGSGVAILLGKGFKSFSSFKLRNPERFVLLLQGESQQVPATPPQPSQPGPSTQLQTPQIPGGVPVRAGSPQARGRYVVVIDPGHGGSDSGAVNKNGEEEKTFTLVIAKDLGAWLQKQGIETILTRNTDTFIPLTQRTAIANFDHADVFLSIHINASPSPLAKGAETYFMSRQATNLWSKQLAEKENASSGGRSPDGNALSMVLWSLAQNRYMAESSDLAEAIQKRLNDLLGTKERGVSQAPFVVLEGAEMPAVLVEVAFLTNPHEAAQLSDSDFQDQVAATLGKAIMDFRAKHDGKNPALPTP